MLISDYAEDQISCGTPGRLASGHRATDKRPDRRVEAVRKCSRSAGDGKACRKIPNYATHRRAPANSELGTRRSSCPPPMAVSESVQPVVRGLKDEQPEHNVSRREETVARSDVPGTGKMMKAVEDSLQSNLIVLLVPTTNMPEIGWSIGVGLVVRRQR